MIAYLEKILNVRRDEFTPAFLLFFYLFLMISFFMMGKAVGVALYLNAFPNQLPQAMIATSLVIGIFVSLYIRLSHRLRLELLIVGTLIFFGLSFALFWWLTRFHGKGVYALIYIWVYMVGAMGPTMGWTLANYVLTTREARRVFGLIGAGGILGGTFGGFVASDVTKHHHATPEALLLALGLILGLCAVLVRLLFWRTRKRLAGLALAPAASHEAPKGFFESWRLIHDSRYLQLITALILVGCTATMIVEYQFNMIAKGAFGANKAALTAFFGSLYGYLGLACFVLQLALTGRLLRSWGIRVTLFVLPVVLVGSSLGVLLLPMLLTAGILKGSHYLLRYSVDKASAELLYLPVVPDVKNQVKSFIDTFVTRLADGTAGIVLWLFANVMKISPSRISLVNFIFLGSWIAVAYGMRREYLNVLRRAIERRTLDPQRTAAGMLDSTTTEVLAMALERGDEQQVLYGLSLFEVSGTPTSHPVLRRLLDHPSPAVRQRALRLLSDASDREILPQVQRLVGDESPEVRTEALHYLVVHEGRDPISLLSTETDFPDYSLQGAVVAYLARTGKPENAAAAQLILEGMLSRTDQDAARAKAEAARVLGVIPPPSELHGQLSNLLRDENPDVAEQALVTAGKVQARDLLPLVIEKLGARRLAPAARTALAQYGGRAVGTLGDYLNDPSVPLATRKQIPGTLAEIPTPESAAVLANSLIQSDPGLRFDIVKAMNKLRQRDPSMQAVTEDIQELFEAELMGYYRSFQILAAFDPSASAARRAPGSESLLTRALRERMEYEAERIFRMLALVYPPRDIHNAFVGLTSGRPRLQANALEVLEHLLRPEHYRMLAYALDSEITLTEKLAFAEQLCHTCVKSKAEALRVLLHAGDPWLCACALYTIGELGLAELADEVRQGSPERDALREETRQWASSRLAAAAAG